MQWLKTILIAELSFVMVSEEDEDAKFVDMTVWSDRQ
jgi:hypothetical protein